MPQQSAAPAEHLQDLDRKLAWAAELAPRFVNVLAGNDRWDLAQQVEFFGQALELGRKHGQFCSFETHRSRSLFTPWLTLDLIRQLPDLRFTSDISHWIVTCERLLDDPHDDLSPFVEVLPDMRLIMEISGHGNSAQAVAYDTIIKRELDKLLRAKPDKNGLCTLTSPSKITRDELFVLFNYCVGGLDPAPKRFTNLLRHKRIVTKRMRVENELPYGIEVTWTATKEWCQEHTSNKQPLRRIK